MPTQSSLSKLGLRQTVKLVVYTLLLVNFAFYLADDIRAASHTMLNGGSFLDWTSTFAVGTQFFYVEPGLVVTDGSGLALERTLALVDVLEVIVWMLILFTIEAMVWLQDRAITRGTLVSGIKIVKFFLYGSLWAAASYWLTLGHWHFAWDEALWIVVFFAIEMNVDDWKKEIEGIDSNTPQPDRSM